MFTRIVLLLVAMVGFAACSRIDITAERNPNGSIDVTVTVSETEVNLMLSEALAESENTEVRNAIIDLQPGQITISGDVLEDNGSGNFVSATFTARLSVVNERLSAEITNADFAGWSANSAVLADINREIEQALQGRAMRDNPNVTLTALVITDNDLSFTLNAKQTNN